MKTIIMIIFCYLVIFQLFNENSMAQLEGQAKIDSLLKELPKMKEDTNAVYLLTNISVTYASINPDEGMKYGEKGLKLAEEINWENGKAKCYNSLGVNNNVKSNFPKALAYFLKALKIEEDLGNKSGIASNLGNIGIIYRNQSDYIKAHEYYYKALKIYQELDNKSGIALNLNFIGNIYQYQSDYIKALKYYHNALKINEELGRKFGIASNLGNIGNVYLSQSEFPKALEYYQKALKVNEETGRKSGVAYNLSYIGYIYYSLSQDEVLTKVNEGTTLDSQNKELNLSKAIKYSLEAIKIFEDIGELKRKAEVYKNIADAYQDIGDYKNAFEAFKEYKTLKDSVFNLDKAKEIANLDAKRDNELKDKEIIILQTEKKAQQFQSYLLGGGVLVLLGAFGIAFLRFREKKKLSEKLAIQNTEIENQKSLVEEKNEQIVSSITYASTIQNAILPWQSTLKNAFSDILIFYKPKDIVSGDSYWFQEINGIKFLAVIDCTGHGIPGAMLTVIASTALDDAVLGKRLFDTGQILSYMNDKVTEVLNQRLSENSIRDGMEIALIAIHQDKVQFSGAGRPLYMKNGTMKIIKTDKRGIAGQTDNDEYQFSSIEIEKSNNLMLYLTTDGYADQMNENSKKFSTKRFVTLLDSISEKPISEQQEILKNEFNSHKGGRSQIDDVTILGVKI